MMINYTDNINYLNQTMMNEFQSIQKQCDSCNSVYKNENKQLKQIIEKQNEELDDYRSFAQLASKLFNKT